MCQSLQQVSALSCEVLITLSVATTSASIVPKSMNKKSIKGWMGDQRGAMITCVFMSLCSFSTRSLSVLVSAFIFVCLFLYFSHFISFPHFTLAKCSPPLHLCVSLCVCSHWWPVIRRLNGLACQRALLIKLDWSEMVGTCHNQAQSHPSPADLAVAWPLDTAEARRHQCPLSTELTTTITLWTWSQDDPQAPSSF